MQTFKISTDYVEHLHPRAIEELETWINYGGHFQDFGKIC
jgi:hypothetical protein